MNRLKLLIADDVAESREMLKMLAHKMDRFDIYEASDGIEAVQSVEEYHPHIVILDVMLSELDGFQASKQIKARHPETLIIALTSVVDPHMEKNMASIGVNTYIHKPIDKNLLHFKLQNFAALIHSREGEFKKLSTKAALNPFCSDIRPFVTMFEISDAESIMDFGIWILTRHDETLKVKCRRMDIAIEVFYMLMRLGVRQNGSMSIIVEESFEELFVTMKFEKVILLCAKTRALFDELGENGVLGDNIACIRLTMHSHEKVEATLTCEPTKPAPTIPEPLVKAEVITPKEEIKVEPILEQSEPTIQKEVKVLETKEKELLRQSFVQKTAAIDYVREIGGDVLDEIRDLESLDEEWLEKLHILEAEPSVDNIYHFADTVLGVYVRAINNLFEFTALAYALSSLGAFLKEHSSEIISDPKKLKTLVMLIEHLGNDLTSWRDHIFALQDTADIHYLDSSFFSSCMQIEQIIGNKEVAANDDDDDGMEFF
ncbi:response regulator [Sulfuricurvum sp.]|uniref:response regulator transcription factor n=1 Tax=Sulfuricurvum sp. TaxID=2025608 RepID=UPI002E3460D4|nr:response regulator [Sulfuricurvum sp.]HEX5330253.1 response regulator [Sulfuricurvum sp.]